MSATHSPVNNFFKPFLIHALPNPVGAYDSAFVELVPTALSLALAGPLFGLSAYSQFIVYKLVPSTSRPGKADKLPCDWRTGQVCSAHSTEYWTDAATAEATAAAWGPEWGVGFVFTESDPWWFLDIDGCLTPEGWSPLAQGLCELLAGCAVEVSQSGKGLHIFGTGVMPPHGCRNQALAACGVSPGR